MLKKEDEGKLNAFEMKCYRWILGIKWQDRIKNVDIRNQLETEENIVNIINKRQLKWFGHVARMDERRWARRLLVAPFEGRRSQGRPRKRFYDNINDLLMSGLQREDKVQINEAIDIAGDRTAWKKLCNSIFMPQRTNEAKAFSLISLRDDE